jgi:hypothetical protein
MGLCGCPHLTVWICGGREPFPAATAIKIFLAFGFFVFLHFAFVEPYSVILHLSAAAEKWGATASCRILFCCGDKACNLSPAIRQGTVADCATPMTTDPHPRTMTTPRGVAGGAVFLTTRWTLVRRAQADSDHGRRALRDLCDAYYEPVAAFLRVELRDAEAARDLRRGFFENVLGGTFRRNFCHLYALFRH